MKIADMETRLESSRLLTYKAAVLKDNKKPFTKVSYFNCYFLFLILFLFRKRLWLNWQRLKLPHL